MTRKSTEHTPKAAVYTVEEIAKILRVSRNTAYEAVRRGEIPTVKIGRRLLVPRTAFESLLAASAESARTAH